jgi:hypothetical protein
VTLVILCYVGVMAIMGSIKSKFAEYECTIKLLTARLEELAAENERLRSEGGAHETLKEIYLNRDAPQGNRIKAAQAALTVEKPRLAMTAYAGKNVTDEVIIPLAQLVEQRRKRQDAMEREARDIEVSPAGIVRVLPRPGSNGSDGDTDH